MCICLHRNARACVCEWSSTEYTNVSVLLRKSYLANQNHHRMCNFCCFYFDQPKYTWQWQQNKKVWDIVDVCERMPSHQCTNKNEKKKKYKRNKSQQMTNKTILRAFWTPFEVNFFPAHTLISIIHQMKKKHIEIHINFKGEGNTKKNSDEKIKKAHMR